MILLTRILQSVSSFRSMQRLVIMLACSLVLVATFICFLAYSYFSFNQESRERLGALGDIIGADVGAALSFGDEQAVSKSLAALKADPSVKQLFVLNELDHVSAYYHQEAAALPADLPQRLITLRSEINRHYFELSPGVERPVIRDGIRLGTILIEQDEHIIIKK